MLRRWRARQSFKAVHEKDLETFLASLGILDAIENRTLTCISCGDIVTLDNLGCVMPMNGEVRVCCEKPSCLSGTLMESLGDRYD
jgi:hypothetical protein